ncbi:hypothetical protein SH139x_001214 [Planctomycetaceae bacterium SH139]
MRNTRRPYFTETDYFDSLLASLGSYHFVLVIARGDLAGFDYDYEQRGAEHEHHDPHELASCGEGDSWLARFPRSPAIMPACLPAPPAEGGRAGGQAGGQAGGRAGGSG